MIFDQLILLEVTGSKKFTGPILEQAHVFWKSKHVTFYSVVASKLKKRGLPVDLPSRCSLEAISKDSFVAV